ncbi:hypothetical protein ACP70R_039338 [Stipagrostis hirtigluma subsp. patula]
MAKFAVLATVLLAAVAAAAISSAHGARTIENSPPAVLLVEAPLSAPVDVAAPNASGVQFEEAADGGAAMGGYSDSVLDNKTPVFGP